VIFSLYFGKIFDIMLIGENSVIQNAFLVEKAIRNALFCITAEYFLQSS